MTAGICPAAVAAARVVRRESANERQSLRVAFRLGKHQAVGRMGVGIQSASPAHRVHRDATMPGCENATWRRICASAGEGQVEVRRDTARPATFATSPMRPPLECTCPITSISSSAGE